MPQEGSTSQCMCCEHCAMVNSTQSYAFNHSPHAYLSMFHSFSSVHHLPFQCFDGNPISMYIYTEPSECAAILWAGAWFNVYCIKREQMSTRRVIGFQHFRLRYFMYKHRVFGMASAVVERFLLCHFTEAFIV